VAKAIRTEGVPEDDAQSRVVRRWGAIDQHPGLAVEELTLQPVPPGDRPGAGGAMLDRPGDGPAVILVGGAYPVRADPQLAELAALPAPHSIVFTYDGRGRGARAVSLLYEIEREDVDLDVLM